MPTAIVAEALQVELHQVLGTIHSQATGLALGKACTYPARLRPYIGHEQARGGPSTTPHTSHLQFTKSLENANAVDNSEGCPQPLVFTY